MKQRYLSLVALSLVGAMLLTFGITTVAHAQPKDMSLEHIKGSNQELVTMLKQTDPDTFLGHKDIIITQDQFEEIGAKAVEVVAGIDSEYDKAVAIQQWVTNHISYDYDNSVEDQNAYTAFIKGEGICQAYSNLTKAMLSYLEIPCILVNGDSSFGGHAWNMAYVDGNWIFIDSTWGAMYTDVEQFSQDHKPYFCDSLQEVEGDYTFTYHNGVAVCDYQGTDTHWDIPDSFRGVPTTALSPKLFNHSGVGKVETISFPATMQNIDNVAYAFKDFASLNEFQVDDANPYFTDVDGALLDHDQTQLLVYPAGNTQTAFQVPDTVTSFAECVFKYNPYLKDVLIPPSVTDLGKDLFHDNNVTIYAQAGSAAATYAQQNNLTLKNPDEFPTHTHNLTAVPAKDSTCTVKGNIPYWYCEECGKCFSDNEAKTEITKAQTELPLAQHTTQLVGKKDATCTEEGYTGDQVCSVCQTVVTKGETIPAKGHNYEDGVCTVCGAEDPDYVVPSQPVEPTPSPDVTQTPEATTSPVVTQAPSTPAATSAPSTNVPPTGDTSSLLLWMSVIALAGSGMLALLAIRRSR